MCSSPSSYPHILSRLSPHSSVYKSCVNYLYFCLLLRSIGTPQRIFFFLSRLFSSPLTYIIRGDMHEYTDLMLICDNNTNNSLLLRCGYRQHIISTYVCEKTCFFLHSNATYDIPISLSLLSSLTFTGSKSYTYLPIIFFSYRSLYKHTQCLSLQSLQTYVVSRSGSYTS